MNMDDQPEDGDYMLVVDIDGTLCELKKEGQSYIDLKPREGMVEKLREYHANGYRILLYTSRNMRTYKGNLGLINRHTAPVLLDWLEKWNIPFDEILFGKPWPRCKGFYVDDRSVRPDEFIELSEQEIQKMLGQDDA
jgi:capsule biosynthesis phosphatase